MHRSSALLILAGGALLATPVAVGGALLATPVAVGGALLATPWALQATPLQMQ